MYHPPKMKIPQPKERRVKVISIREPWITAMLLHGKRCENRNKNSHYRGKLYLHASQKYDREGHAWLVEQGYILPQGIKTGGLKATVNMTNCVKVTKEMREQDPFAFGPYALIFEDVKAFRFLPCKGQLAIPFEVDLWELRRLDVNEGQGDLFS